MSQLPKTTNPVSETSPLAHSDIPVVVVHMVGPPAVYDEAQELRSDHGVKLVCAGSTPLRVCEAGNLIRCKADCHQQPRLHC